LLSLKELSFHILEIESKYSEYCTAKAYKPIGVAGGPFPPKFLAHLFILYLRGGVANKILLVA